jgi:hypothetical protein
MLEQMKGEMENVKIVWTRNGFQLKENDDDTTLSMSIFYILLIVTLIPYMS